MAIRKDILPIAGQSKFELLSKADQIDILNCQTIEEAMALLGKKKRK